MWIRNAVGSVRKFNKERNTKRLRNILEFTKHYEQSPVKSNRIIFESFHGKNISDSPFFMLKAFLRREESKSYEIFYSTNDLEKHKAFIEALGLPVKLVTVDTPEYAEVLATSKYLVNNSSFPQWFIKKDEQRYIQTWHGVPLKTLGKRMRLGIESMYNVQHNFLQADYITFPNEFTREAIMRDYNLEDLYTGTVAMLGYPRNDIFHDRAMEQTIRERCGLMDKECFAYMPTWRGTSNHSLDVTGYSKEMDDFLGYLDEQLRDDQVFFVNFHSMLEGKISIGSYKHIRPFPKDVNNYEFLNAMDCLVTDYSSVFFDYSITGKPVILFTYDLEEYLHDRGLYLDITELPFPQLDTKEKLAAALTDGSYKDTSYTESEYAGRYLSYEAPDNSERMLDLLFGHPAEEIELRDYSGNKEKTWNYLRYDEIANELYLDDICRNVNPETDILLLPRNSFTESMSAYLHDNFRDDFNFIFMRDDTTTTYTERVRALFNGGKIKAHAKARDEKRIFGHLKVKEKNPSVCSGVPGSVCNVNLELILKSEVKLTEKGLAIDFDAKDYELERFIVINRKKDIMWSKPVSREEAKDGHFEVDLIEVLRRDILRNKERMHTFFTARNKKGRLLLLRIVHEGVKTGSKCDGFIGTLEFTKDEFTQEELGSTRFLSANKGDVYCINVVRNRAVDNLQLIANYEPMDIATIWHGKVDRIRFNKNGKVSLRASLENLGAEISGMYLKYRSNDQKLYLPLEYQSQLSGGKHIITSTFNLKELELKEVHWDLVVWVRFQGKEREIKLRCNSLYQKIIFRIRDTQVRLDNGMTVLAYQTRSGDIAFTYREISPYETVWLRCKELLATFVYYALYPYWSHRKIWLVYEKFCKMAQDNGYYFFRYCMENKKNRKNIYYIIDKNAKDYEMVKEYGSNVVDYMSFKHILYLMAARIYVGSDSKAHVYVWRSRPSFVNDRVQKRRIFFLQHGVTAMKRVDPLFGKHGSSPMSYFTTTSANEQSIVTKYFGYKLSEAPIAGFARWDALVNHADPERPRILVMPTWRSWLDDSTEETFLTSDYFKVYSSLITSAHLEELLDKYNITLTFYIHPKLSEHLKLFSSDNPRVELIEQGTKKLNQIMMESSMIITDYSSVAWDMLYMDKPVVYYQFDQERYLLATGSYIDFDTELPGEVCRTETAVLEAIDKLASGGFRMTEEAIRRCEGWYYKKDHDNSKRTFEFLKKKGC